MILVDMWLVIIASVVGLSSCFCPFSGMRELPQLSPSDGDSNSSDACLASPPRCDPNYKYRSPNGSCNNLKHPTWGMVNTEFRRLSLPQYGDGEKLPRRAKSGQELPSARKLSLEFWPDRDVPDDVTLLVMQFFQLVAHDIVISPAQSNVGDCCGDAANNTLGCAPISIAQTDPFYSKYNVTCRPMTRTATTFTLGCKSALPMQQVNGVTHLLDCSQIYGSNNNTATSLREKNLGRLLTNTTTKREFLPSAIANRCFNSSVCYRAGDVRVNQNLQLTSLQTTFAREHNRIANKLASINPNWDDERLYQESRAILVACYQHIIYDQLLPIVVGKCEVRKGKLKPKVSGYTDYDENLPPVINNELTAAALRVVHSNIQGQLELSDYSLNVAGLINISDFMNSPRILEEDSTFDYSLLGLINQRMQTTDEYVTKEMNGKLFHGPNNFGNDLTAMDVQRGRDHGIPSYVTILKFCTGIEITSFKDLERVIPLEEVIKLEENYDCFEDIDLFVGGSLEMKAAGRKLGPTFHCVISDQFYRLKWGDRFWYETRNQPHSLTRAQIAQIRKANLARIICDNSDKITRLQRNVFYPPSDRNRIVNCSEIPEVDLLKWKDS